MYQIGVELLLGVSRCLGVEFTESPFVFLHTADGQIDGSRCETHTFLLNTELGQHLPAIHLVSFLE